MLNRRRIVYQFISDYSSAHHYPPTYEEIRAGCGLASKSGVAYHIKALERSGELSRTPHTARALALNCVNDKKSICMQVQKGN